MAGPSQIIDPPVSVYSSPEDLRAWLDELRHMEPTPDVQDAIEQAKCWLVLSQQGSSQTGEGNDV